MEVLVVARHIIVNERNNEKKKRKTESRSLRTDKRNYCILYRSVTKTIVIIQL